MRSVNYEPKALTKKIFVQLSKKQKPPILCLSIVYILFRGQYKEILKHEKALLQVPHA